MKQEDWTSRLRERLENHETPAPEGLWQQIESALPAGRKAKVTPLKKWIAAAAAVMIVGGVELGLLWKSDNSENVVARDVVNSVSDVFDNKSNSSSDDISNTDISDELVAQAISSKSENVRISVGNKYFIVSSINSSHSKSVSTFFKSVLTIRLERILSVNIQSSGVAL